MYFFTPAYSQKAKLRIKTMKGTEFGVLQWQKILEEKEKVTRSAIFDSRKYLPSQKYVRMTKKISFIYLCFIYMVYSQIKGKRFQGKITKFIFQNFLWKRIATKVALKKSLKKQHCWTPKRNCKDWTPSSRPLA